MMRMFWAGASSGAALLLSLAAAQASTVNISGSGFFDAGTPATAESAPGQTFTFSFFTPDPIPGNPDTDLISPTYALAGSSIAPTITSVTFQTFDNGGLFDLLFSDDTKLSIYGDDIDADGFLQAGFHVAAVGVNNMAPAGSSYGSVSVSVDVSPVPLPGAAPMFGCALLGLGAAGALLKGRGKARGIQSAASLPRA